MRGAESRVTIDVDPIGSWVVRTLRAHAALSRHAEELEIRVSASGEGIHLIGYFTDRLAPETKDAMRANLSDDATRLYLDTVRSRVGHMDQVCWTEKGGETADFDFTDIWAAIDHVKMNRGKVGNGVMI